MYPVIWHFGTELIVSEELGKISLEHNLMSIGICAAVFLILFFLFHSLRVASLAGCIFYGVFGAVEYYTIAFRSIPVMYSDLLDNKAFIPKYTSKGKREEHLGCL